MADSGRFVAIGLLTQRDLDVLGSSFRGVFPLDNAAVFDDLLEAISASERQARPDTNESDGPK